MNWEALSAIGQLLGAAAVLITLIYLAIQIRQSTAAMNTTTYETIVTGFNDVNSIVVDNPDVASILHRGMENPTTLSDVEAVRFSFLVRCWSNQWLKLLRLYQRGALSAAEWRPFAEEAAQFFWTPGGKLFQSENRVFAELYVELAKHGGREVSRVRLGETKGGVA